MELKPFVRTKNGCYRLHKFRGLGTTYRQIEDPKGEDIADATLSTFYLDDNFPKISLDLLRRIVSFYRQYITNLSPNSQIDTNEVQVLLLRNEDTLTNWKVVAPLQVISRVTVEARTARSCDLETGESYEVFPPEGWLHGGSSHSHNNMSPFFSSKDDKGELEVPGLHFVIGCITKDSFSVKASIVVNKKRYIIDPVHVLEITDLPSTLQTDYVRVIQDSVELPVHENVHKYISRQSFSQRLYKGGAVPTAIGKVNKISTVGDPFEEFPDLFEEFPSPFNHRKNSYKGFFKHDRKISQKEEELSQRIELLTKAYFLLEDMAQEQMKEEVFALLAITGFITADKAGDICGGTYYDTAEDVARFVFSDEIDITNVY